MTFSVWCMVLGFKFKPPYTHDVLSKLVESFDLLKAIDLLMNVQPPTITSALTDKIRALHLTAQPEHRIPDSTPTRITIGPDEDIFTESHLAKVAKIFDPRSA